jgi:type III restriction enzyme
LAPDGAFNEWGSTRFVDFVTSKKTLYPTDPSLCHVNYVVADSDWEKAFPVAIERELADICFGYVKNHNLGFEVPYEYRGEMHAYRPDFILKIDDGRGNDDPLHLIIEVKGRKDDRDLAKADTMHKRWVPAVNSARKYGRWAYAMLESPHTFGVDVRELLKVLKEKRAENA